MGFGHAGYFRRLALGWLKRLFLLVLHAKYASSPMEYGTSSYYICSVYAALNPHPASTCNASSGLAATGRHRQYMGVDHRRAYI
jgi:hypothetical protein